MAIAATTMWEFNSAATANNVNGGGFNYTNANFLTDGSFTGGTGNTPELSSATYSFLSTDENAWVYLSNTTKPGFYKISSVTSGKATLDAASGNGVVFDSTTNRWKPSTSAGIDSSATPSSKTFGVDYSQTQAAIVNGITDFAANGASTTLQSLTAAFTPVMVGNIFHQTTTGTGAHGVTGWYEIVSYTNATNVVLDRTPNDGSNSLACTGYIGGAMSLNSSLDDDFIEMIQGGNTVWFRAGTYTLGETTSIASTNSTGISPSNIIGYSSVRGDTISSGSRPVTIACGANSFSLGQFINIENFVITGTASSVFTGGIGTRASNLKCSNSSTTADRAAFTSGTSGHSFRIEAISQQGRAISATSNSSKYLGMYAHNSKVGINLNTTGISMSHILVQACWSQGLLAATTSFSLTNSTLYAYQSPKSSSVGVSISASIDTIVLLNCIIAGWVTGVAGTTSQRYSNRGAFNCFYNNTTNASLYNLDATDITTDPSFTTVTELSGSTATTSGSVLTQSGGDFSTVTDNTDYVYIVSGTGVTQGSYLITSHTSTTITLNNAPGTNATADKVWVINTGKDLSVGTNMKAAGYPGLYLGSNSTSYMDLGAVQRVEGSGSSGGSYVFG